MTVQDTLPRIGDHHKCYDLLMDAAKAAGWTWTGGVRMLAGVPREIVEAEEAADTDRNPAAGV